jgi:hypothetical protein
MAKRSKGASITKLTGGVQRTPKGIARFAYVNRPDDSTYGKDRFRVTVVFDKNDPEFKAFAQKVTALAKQHAAEIGQSGTGNVPLKLVNEKMADRTGDAVGTPYMEFESNSSFVRNGEEVSVTIPIFNAKGQEEDVQVYGGDIVRVEARFAGWELNGDHGVKGYLNAVQQLQSNWQGGTGTTFQAEDEYLTEGDASEAGEEVLDTPGSGFADESDAPDAPAPEADTSDDPLAGLV